MCIKKRMRSIGAENVCMFDKKTTMETHLPIKFLDAHPKKGPDFVLLDTQNGNAALFANVLRDIPIFHTS